MDILSGKKIVYIGDWVFYTGPNFIESPFEMMSKDCHLQFLGKPVTDSLEKQGAEVKAYSNWDLYHWSPEQYESIIGEADVVILSDVEARCFCLSPDFFDRSKYHKDIITFPDRLKFLAKQVEQGTGLLFMGGWLAFSGYMEKGGWRRCTIRDWLPFECLAGEDMMETSEGFSVQTEEGCESHPVFDGLDLQAVPPLMGYNEIIPKDNFKTLLTVKETGHSLLGVSEIGKGRMVTYASDPVPHWGLNLMLWNSYEKFWQNIVKWLLQ